MDALDLAVAAGIQPVAAAPDELWIDIVVTELEGLPDVVCLDEVSGTAGKLAAADPVPKGEGSVVHDGDDRSKAAVTRTVSFAVRLFLRSRIGVGQVVAVAGLPGVVVVGIIAVAVRVIKEDGVAVKINGDIAAALDSQHSAVIGVVFFYIFITFERVPLGRPQSVIGSAFIEDICREIAVLSAVSIGLHILLHKSLSLGVGQRRALAAVFKCAVEVSQIAVILFVKGRFLIDPLGDGNAYGRLKSYFDSRAVGRCGFKHLLKLPQGRYLGITGILREHLGGRNHDGCDEHYSQKQRHYLADFSCLHKYHLLKYVSS